MALMRLARSYLQIPQAARARGVVFSRACRCSTVFFHPLEVGLPGPFSLCRQPNKPRNQVSRIKTFPFEIHQFTTVGMDIS